MSDRGNRVGLALFWLVALPGCAALRGPRPEERIVAARGLCLQAVDASRQGAWPEARKLFEKALETCPVDVHTHRQYAESLWLHGERNAALDEMRQAVRLSARSPDLLVAYGEMLLQAGHVEEADRVATDAVSRAPLDAEALALRGDVWMAQQKFDAAMEIYHRALQSRPSFPRVQLAIARLDYLRGQPLRCLATLSALTQGLPQEREPDEAIWLEGVALKALGRHSDAAVRFETLVARGGRSPDLFRELADCRWAAGDRHGAREALQQLQQLYPAHPATRELMAQFSEQPRSIR